jgi:hypothetical protein
MKSIQQTLPEGQTGFRKVALILESQEEVDKFYAIFRVRRITQALEWPEDVYLLLEKYANKENAEVWYQKILSILKPE